MTANWCEWPRISKFGLTPNVDKLRVGEDCVGGSEPLAPIHHHIGACNEGSAWARKEQCDVADVLGETKAAQRHEFFERGGVVGVWLRIEISFLILHGLLEGLVRLFFIVEICQVYPSEPFGALHEAGHDSIDDDAVRAPLDSECLGDGIDAGFGSAVVQEAPGAVPVHGGADIDNDASPSLLHALIEYLLTHLKCAEGVYFENPPHGIDWQLLGGGHEEACGSIDQDVDFAEIFNYLSDYFLAIANFRDVARIGVADYSERKGGG